jgi:cytoplasmic iron level regulating protein YaaA (DUF328/UPF0246 family)
MDGASVQIIISPAKKMVVDTDSLPVRSYPLFINAAKELLAILQQVDYTDLQKMWKCNDAIAQLNYERIKTMDLYHNLTPAIMAYDGIQYKYMAPGVFEINQLQYINKHLFIMSGLYGLLRPLDGVVPYRLEMQSKVPTDRFKDLYAYWKEQLNYDCPINDDLLLNLASREYSKMLISNLPSKISMFNCIFAELCEGHLVEKGIKCKMVRGAMVRWLAENNVNSIAELKEFDCLSYVYCAQFSTEYDLVFLQRRNEKC